MTQPSTTPPAQAPRHSRSRWVLVVTGIVGGTLLLAAIVSAAITGIAALGSADSDNLGTLIADVKDLERIELKVGSADFLVNYSSAVEQAELEVRDDAGKWNMRRDDDTLVIDHRRSFGINWWLPWIDARQQVVLHLPEALRHAELDADLELKSGRLEMTAAFGELNAEVSSGSMRIDGSAHNFEGRVSSGDMEFLLDGVQSAHLNVSSGELTGVLAGKSPQSVRVQVSSGLAQVELPNATYDLRSQVSSGSFDHDLRTDPGASRLVEVNVSSGRAQLISSR